MNQPIAPDLDTINNKSFLKKVEVLGNKVPDGALLRNPQTGSVFNSPFMRGIVPLLFLFLLSMRLTYGIKAGSIKSGDDVIKMMGQSIKGLSGFLVMAFGMLSLLPLLAGRMLLH